MKGSDTLVAFGGTVKFVDDAKTRIGGYLVRFTGPDSPDLVGDYFDAATDFGGDVEGKSLGLYYQHGFDPALGNTRIGAGTIKSQDDGLWYEAQLEISEDYRKQIEKLIEDGRLGYSSGAAAHLVGRAQVKDSDAMHLKAWPLAEASLTPNPAEPRNIVSIKALADALKSAHLDTETKPEGEAEGTSAAEPVEATTSAPEAKSASGDTPDKEPIMEQENQAPETQEQVEAKATTEVPTFTMSDVQAEIKKLRDEFEASNTKSNPGLNTGAPALISHRGVSTNQALKAWLAKGDNIALKDIPGMTGDGNRVELKASNAVDMQVGTAGEGGNVVTDDMFGQIIARRDERMLANILGVRRFTGTGTTLDVPTDGEADGEFVSTAEEGTFDKDTPALTQTALTLVKYTKNSLISYELLQDAAANVEEFLMDFVARGAAKTHNNLLITESAANGTALKVTASTTVLALGELEAAAFTNDLVEYIDGPQDAAWVGQAATLGSIYALGGTSNRYYAPTAQGDPVGMTVLGFPYRVTGKAAAYGTAGNKFLHFGAWNHYMGLYESPSFEFLRDPYSASASGQVGFRFYFRADYGVLQAEAGGFIRHTNT